MQNNSYSVLIAAITALGSLGCAADTSGSESSLRVEYHEDFQQLIIFGQSDWDGLADIWVDEGTELVNYGPLELEGSIQAMTTRFDPSWTVSIRERVTQEERVVLFTSDAERTQFESEFPEDGLAEEDVEKIGGLCWNQHFRNGGWLCRNRVCYQPNGELAYVTRGSCTWVGGSYR